MFWGRDSRILFTLLVYGAVLAGLANAGVVEAERQYGVGSFHLEDGVLLPSVPVSLWTGACDRLRGSSVGGLTVAGAPRSCLDLNWPDACQGVMEKRRFPFFAGG